MTKAIERIAVVGTGVIGASWATFYLSKGFKVTATDPAPGAEDRLRAYVQDAWGLLVQHGIAQGASIENLSFTPNLSDAVSQADFVQENGPERPDLKMQLFADMDAAARPDVILASSSSGLTMDVIQTKCAHPERCVIGHPFNPPHILPLVEVVGGAKTSADTIARAMDFYMSVGKKAIRLNKAMPGHVANRLQAALYKEVLYLVQQGVLNIQDADAAICYGPGLRWGVMGPSLLWHLGGGPGGIQHFMEHLMTPLAGLIGTLAAPDVTEELKKTVIDGVLQEAKGLTPEQFTAKENEVVLGLLDLRDKVGL